MRRRLGLSLAVLVLLAALGLADALWFEPRVLLFQDTVRFDLPVPPLRAVHLSDLHISEDLPLLRRLLRRTAAADPDVIFITGDFIRDVPQRGQLAKHIEATAAFVSALRRIAPVVAVQGHSEHQGEVVTALDRAGAAFLSNEGRRIGPGGRLLLLGLNQQVGRDHLAFEYPSPFDTFQEEGRWHYGARHGEPPRNFYSHWDPAPRDQLRNLLDESGPLAWSGYEATVDLWIDGAEVGAGLAVHSRYVLGEDRMYRLSRDEAKDGGPGNFFLWSRGTMFTGKADDLDTGVDPQPGRWYRMRLRTEVGDGVVRVLGRVWPADGREPRDWQVRGEDRSKYRLESGTVGFWARGGGTVLYRDLRVTDLAGKPLLAAPLQGRARPAGFREGARDTRLALALARSPYTPPGITTVVLSHTPAVALEASLRGIEAVIAGHTHGGQVRLPFFGALTTRDSLGALYDFGRFDFAAPNARGTTTLYINAGIGTSLLPVRFWCPPRFAVLELGRMPE